MTTLTANPLASPAVHASKRALRALLLAQRFSLGRGHTQRTMQRWLESAAHQLNTQHAGATVALYAPHKGEVDVRRLAALIHHPLCLPVVQDAANSPHQALQFARWQAGDALAADRYGIATPVKRDWIVPSVLLVPCVGFTANGLRLGYGGGYYDRTLAALHAQNTNTCAIGVAWQSARCVFDADEHDVAMDGVWAL